MEWSFWGNTLSVYIDEMKSIIVICEGKSETKYLQELNRFLREQSVENSIVFVPKEVGTGHFTEVVKKYRNERKLNKKANIEIWVDYDIYKRNEQRNYDKYKKKPKGIPNFKFNYFNFEDFLIMHFNDDVLNKWKEICKANNHFNEPMKSDKYLKLIKENIFSDYDKSSLTNLFVFNKQTLENLFKHNAEQSEIKSDFAEFLREVFSKIN